MQIKGASKKAYKNARLVIEQTWESEELYELAISPCEKWPNKLRRCIERNGENSHIIHFLPAECSSGFRPLIQIEKRTHFLAGRVLFYNDGCCFLLGPAPLVCNDQTNRTKSSPWRAPRVF